MQADHAQCAYSLLTSLLNRQAGRALEPRSQVTKVDMGQLITDEINSDPEEVARLRRAIQQSREGKRRRLDDAMPNR